MSPVGSTVAPQRGRCTARAGVAGNPSDAIGGAALAIPVPELAAEVVLADAAQLTVRPGHTTQRWDSVHDLVEHTGRFGHDGGDRLVTAAIVTLATFARESGHDVDDSPFDAVWQTDIPRSVGLAGSSAVVIATMRALMARWSLEVQPDLLAALALDAESRQLGVAAGWMDRAVQAHERPTLVDTRTTTTRAGRAVPNMTVLSTDRPVDLVVAWDESGASPSGRLHRGLAERAAAGERVVLRGVEALVDAAHDAAEALVAGDRDALAGAVDRSCALRDEFGALDATTASLVDVARAAGAAATSAGSGGAVLVVPMPGASAVTVDAFVAKGLRALSVGQGRPAIS